uniref:Uncharacterized protein n=1 Tax=Arundo donax TaxID=35708 RepID=A0A0A9TZ47_ARUDO
MRVSLRWYHYSHQWMPQIKLLLM